MRAALLCFGLLVVVGCGGSSPTTSGPTAPPVEAKGKVEAAPTGKPEPVQTLDLLTAYKDNELGADAKYKGKWLRFPIRLFQIDREDGKARVTAEGFFTIGPGSHPTVVAYLRAGQEAVAAKYKIGDLVEIEATCRGRVSDGIERGSPQWNFRVEFDDATIHPFVKK